MVWTKKKNGSAKNKKIKRTFLLFERFAEGIDSSSDLVFLCKFILVKIFLWGGRGASTVAVEVEGDESESALVDGLKDFCAVFE